MTIFATDTDMKRVIRAMNDSYAVGQYIRNGIHKYTFKLGLTLISPERLSKESGDIYMYPDSAYSSEPNAQECDATGAK